MVSSQLDQYCSCFYKRYKPPYLHLYQGRCYMSHNNPLFIFVQFKRCYRASKCHFQIYWRRVVDSTFAFNNPSYSKDPRFRALWDTTTFTPTCTEILVCTRVTLSKLNMDMVFRVGGRSRQCNRMLKTSGSFIINE